MAEPAYTVASDSETTSVGREDRAPSNFPDITIGIDIGTSQCSVAIWNGSEVELLKNTRNQKLMRSYVAFGNNNNNDVPSGDLISGPAAHHGELEILSGAAIFNTKRLIGRSDTDPIVIQSAKTLPFLVQSNGIGARPFVAALVNGAWRATTPEEVLSIFLVEVRAVAELRLKRHVRSAVLTVPASFTRFQLSRVERACAAAGLRALRLIPEPAAVALLHAQQHQRTAYDDTAGPGGSEGGGAERLAVVFNMGAGYSDAAVSATAGGVSQIRSIAGCAVGGEDLLQNTIRVLFPGAVDEIVTMGKVRLATQDAIHELSERDSVWVELTARVLKRVEFEEANREVFERCAALVGRVLRDARLEPGEVDDVIAVGGCSNVPRVKQMLSEIFQGKELYKGIGPLEAAVSGAALEAAVASGVTDPFGYLDLLTIQVTPLAIGIRANGGQFVAVVPRNTTIPAKRDAIFTTAHDDQSEALIVVHEVGDDEGEETRHLIGYFKVVGIPAGPRGSREVSVCMDIDASNVLRVFAGVVRDGSYLPGRPFMEVRMPNVDDGHGWCDQALTRAYGSSLDLVTPKHNTI